MGVGVGRRTLKSSKRSRWTQFLSRNKGTSFLSGKETPSDKPSTLFENSPVYLSLEDVPWGDLLFEAFSLKLNFKSMYFPRNRVAPFRNHRCLQALLGRLPQVSFNTSLRPGGELFISSLWERIIFLPLPVLVPVVLWMGTHALRDEKWAGGKPEPD